MPKGFLKSSRPPKVSNEMKYTNEKIIWNTQEMNLSWYVPKANVDHTISSQLTAISSLDHHTKMDDSDNGIEMLAKDIIIV